jgi:hypothetical protein
VIHNAQDVNNAFLVIDPPNQAEAIVADIEHDTVPHLVCRPERLPEGGEITPLGIPRELQPAQQIPFGPLGVIPPRLPEFA